MSPLAADHRWSPSLFKRRRSLKFSSLAVFCLALMLLALADLAPRDAVAAEPSREDRIKAAIVYKIGKFIEWPSSAFDGPDSALDLCLLGPDAFSASLSGVAGPTVQGRPIRFRMLDSAMSAGLERCHILFVPRSASLDLSLLFQKLSGKPVLTVSDHPAFASHGGMIALVRSGNRLSFGIDLEATRAAGLNVSAQLLDLATISKP